MTDVLAQAPVIDFPAGIDGHIVTIDGLFDPLLIEQFLAFAMDACPIVGRPGITMGGLLPDVKSSQDFRFTEFDTWTGDWSVDALMALGFDVLGMDAVFAETLGSALQHYRDAYPALAKIPLRDTGYQIQKYTQGRGHYELHVDADPGMEPGRVLACITYLNDVAEGGRTHFPLHGISVAPVAGRILLFPAGWTHPHQGQMPVSEDKYVVTTFTYHRDIP